jgi:hypothetical protein
MTNAISITVTGITNADGSMNNPVQLQATPIAGNVYVAVKGGNQVWKFNPTADAFVADTNFGVGGCVGSTNGTAGTGTNEFNAPYDVAVSPDGGTTSVSVESAQTNAPW